MLKEFQHRPDQLLKAYTTPTQSLFYKKLAKMRPFSQDLLMRKLLKSESVEQIQSFERKKTYWILSVFGISLMPVIFFRKIPIFKYKSRLFRIMFSALLLLVPNNVNNYFLMLQQLQLQESIYKRQSGEFEEYLKSGDFRSYQNVVLV